MAKKLAGKSTASAGLPYLGELPGREFVTGVADSRIPDTNGVAHRGR